MRRLRVRRVKAEVLRRTGIVLLALAAFGLVAYAEIVRPNQQAAAYELRLSSAADELQACFDKLADTHGLPVFYAPDTPLERKRQDVTAIRTAIDGCVSKLEYFNGEAQTLRPMKLAGYTEEFRSAQALRQHALNVAGQSNDVLGQYRRLADFLDRYYAALVPFERYFHELNGLTDVAVLGDRVNQLAQQGAELHARADGLRGLKAFPGFEPVIKPTADMLDRSADGYDYLASGYGYGNDASIAIGFELAERAVADYDSTIKALPFDLLQKTYIVGQVGELPGKIEDLRREEAE